MKIAIVAVMVVYMCMVLSMALESKRDDYAKPLSAKNKGLKDAAPDEIPPQPIYFQLEEPDDI